MKLCKYFLLIAMVLVQPSAFAAEELDLNDINVPAAGSAPAGGTMRNMVYSDKVGVDIRVFGAYGSEQYDIGGSTRTFDATLDNAPGIDFGAAIYFQPRLSKFQWMFEFEQQTHGFGGTRLRGLRPATIDLKRVLATVGFMFQPFYSLNATGEKLSWWHDFRFGVGYRFHVESFEVPKPGVAIMTPKNMTQIMLRARHSFPLAGDRWRMEPQLEFAIPHRFQERTGQQTGYYRFGFSVQPTILVGYEFNDTYELMFGAEYNYSKIDYIGIGTRTTSDAKEKNAYFQLPVMLNIRL